MKGLRHYSPKEQRAVRRRNHIHRDLRTPKYEPRIKEVKKQHLLDEIAEREAEEEYWFLKELGLSSKQ